MKTITVKLSQIHTNEANPRKITTEKFAKLENRLLAFPKMLEIRPIVVDDTCKILGGNMRFRALTEIAKMGDDEIKARLESDRSFKRKTTAEQEFLIDYWKRWKDDPTAPIVKASELTEDEKNEFIIVDNSQFGSWDMDTLANVWDEKDLDDWGVDVWQTEESTEGDTEEEPEGNTEERGTLAERFVIPPFSILDARSGSWQERKKEWCAVLGKYGTAGDTRKNTLKMGMGMRYPHLYSRTTAKRKQLGISFKEYLECYATEEEKKLDCEATIAGVSLTDPVLAEAMCKWFAPHKGAKIFDCFSGAAREGLVFSLCGHEFVGVEIRQEQVDENNERVKEFGSLPMPIKYICGDSQNLAEYIAAESQDLLFTSPPYYDLEVYSDLENDASAQGTYEDCMTILRNAFAAAIGRLRQNRFAVIVVGDVRDKKTRFSRNYISDIKQIFIDNGMPLYNELILAGMIGNAALRAGRTLNNSRYVTRTHQHVLVFYKGDPKEINKEFPPIEYTEEELAKFDEAYSVGEADEDLDI